jgi:hypothetical protein
MPENSAGVRLHQAFLLRYLRGRINGGTLDLMDLLNRSFNLLGFSQG